MRAFGEILAENRKKKVKAGMRLYRIIINYPQHTVMHIFRIVIFRKGKVKPAVQPAETASSHFAVINLFHHCIYLHIQYVHV